MKYSKIAEIIFPARCPVCRKIQSGAYSVCGECKRQLVRVEQPACKKCGRYIFDCKCKHLTVPAYESVIAPYNYVKGIKDAVFNLKFYGMGNAADFLADAMSASVEKHYNGIAFDFITAVPLHSKRKRKRGYNQSDLLCERMAKSLGIEFKKNVLKKIRHTANQHELGREERQTNLIGAFTCEQDLNGKTLLLADDIVTTGATLGECSKELYKAGAKAVYAVVAAVV